MNTRQLGKNGPAITEIGLGTWAMGGPWAFGWGRQDDAVSVSAIRRAVDLGINWIDTAPVYGLGRGEKVVAEALKDRRKEVLIATKCGLIWDANGRVDRNNRPESIRRSARPACAACKRTSSICIKSIGRMTACPWKIVGAK